MKRELSSIPNIKLVQEKTDFLEFTCESKDFENICFNFQSQFGYIWLLDIVAIDNGSQSSNGQLKLEYYFLNVENGFLFSLNYNSSFKDEVKSIAHMWRNASAFEQEINELFGVQFSRDYINRFFAADNKNFPFQKNCSKPPVARTQDDDHNGDIIFQPSHPLKEGIQKLHVYNKGSLVERCVCDSGNFHIGLEKILEQVSLNESFEVIENYIPLEGAHWSILMAQNIERSNGIDIPNRAKCLRMVILEFVRILGHIRFIHEQSIELECESIYQASLSWIKRTQSIMMSYSGNEFFQDVVRPGGVTKDASQVWLSRVVDELTLLESSILGYYKSILLGDSWKTSLNNHLISKKIAGNWGVSGPLSRAVGLNLDLRKLSPFYFYNDISFDVPIGVNGTDYDLLMVRVEEIFQSIKIIIQVLDNLPTGQLIAPEVLGQDKSQKINLEDINHFSLLEGVNGAMSFASIFKNGKCVRSKMTSPGFVQKSLFEKVVQGKELSKVIPLWRALDIDMKVVER